MDASSKLIFNEVLKAMQDAEELGGVSSTEQYIELMQAIASECQKRSRVAHVMHAEANVRLLADAFRQRMQESLDEEILREIDNTNRASEGFLRDNECASHDHCDANLIMEDAFNAAMGRASEVSSETDAALWSAAWALAKKTGFSSTTENQQGKESSRNEAE